MTTHKTGLFTALAAILLLTLMACKTPQATLPKDNIKATLPTVTTDTVTNVHVWRDFFKDPVQEIPMTAGVWPDGFILL